MRTISLKPSSHVFQIWGCSGFPLTFLITVPLPSLFVSFLPPVWECSPQQTPWSWAPVLHPFPSERTSSCFSHVVSAVVVFHHPSILWAFLAQSTPILWQPATHLTVSYVCYICLPSQNVHFGEQRPRPTFMRHSCRPWLQLRNKWHNLRRNICKSYLLNKCNTNFTNSLVNERRVPFDQQPPANQTGTKITKSNLVFSCFF